MASYSQTIIVGNVGNDPKQDQVGGRAHTSFNVCVNKVSGHGDERQEVATWYRVSVWGEYAVTIASLVSKGCQVLAEGEIKCSAYIDKGSGKAVATMEINARAVRVLYSPFTAEQRSERKRQTDWDGTNERRQAVPSGYGDDMNEIPF